MTPQRFEELAAAYGGRIALWPEAERDDATLFVAAEPSFAQAVLATASDLDAALEVWAPPSVDVRLRDSVLAAAPRPRRRARLAEWFWRAGVGAGLATACAAGLVVGVSLSPEPHGEDVVASAMTSFEVASVEDAV